MECYNVLLWTVIVLLVLVFLFRKGIMKKFFVMQLSHFVVYYNKRLESFKKSLFQDLFLLKSNLKSENLTVCEIGAGTGANFSYYPRGTEVICIDPNDIFERSLKKSHSELGDHVKLKAVIKGFAEDMSKIPDGSVDAVVCTLVLCSVKDTKKSLSEVKRILKPGGKFFFLEHVRARENGWLHFAQRVMVLCGWGFMFDGCSLTRKPWEDIESAGFSVCSINKFDAPIFIILKPHIMGTATK